MRAPLIIALCAFGFAACGDEGPGGAAVDAVDATSAPDADTPDGAAVDAIEDAAACDDDPCGDSCTCPDHAPHCYDGACHASPPCPVAVFDVAEGREVIPGTMLNLSAAQSTSPGSTITAWEWSVAGPPGSNPVFLPSADVESPQLEAAVVGGYYFTLKVYDAAGNASCNSALETVVVSVPNAIHVELVWTTPGDADETDTGHVGDRPAGSDLDLHFMHPLAVGATNPEGWFHAHYDTYWGNPGPDWGKSRLTWPGEGSEDDPSLDRDDSDGAGPEIITLNVPEDDTTYTVGVHYWDDSDYGDSYATVRIYIHGLLAFEWADIELTNESSGVGDMWECCTIAWPSGVVNKIEDGDPGSGVPFIRPAYSDPSQFPF